MSNVFLDLKKENYKFENNKNKKANLYDYLISLLMTVLVFTPVISNIFAGLIFGFICLLLFGFYVLCMYYSIKSNFNCFYIKGGQNSKITNNLYIQKLYGYLNIKEKIINIFVGDRLNVSKGHIDFIFLNSIESHCVLKITPFSKNFKVNKTVEKYSAYNKKDVEMFFKQLYKNNIILFRDEREGIFKNIYNVIKHEDKEEFAIWLKDYINNYEKYSTIMNQKEKLENFSNLQGKQKKNKKIL